MKKVLLITYYWPPSGGAGVQRVLKTVKYLREFGWEPIVFTAQNPAYPILDPSLLADVPPGQEVIRGPIWEPYEWYKRFTGQTSKARVYSGFLSETEKPSLSKRLSIWIRGNFFIPDARAFWIRPATRFLTDYLRKHPVDAILSSGPPHTVHMIARNVKRATGLPWAADFRDPWTNIDFYDQLMLSRWADRRHKKLERSVVQEADHVTTVSPTWQEEFRALGARAVSLIYNGYDPADFAFEKGPPEAVFCFNHIGFLNSDRNPPRLWEAFGELCREIPGLREALKLRFTGKTDAITLRQLAAQGLEDRVEQIDYIPHSEALPRLCRSQALLLLVNDVPNVMGHIPGKTFEYVASRRPVLAIGPETADFAQVITGTQSGVVCDFQDKDKMKRTILSFFRKYKKGELNTAPADITRYSRQQEAGQMAAVLTQIVASRRS